MLISQTANLISAKFTNQLEYNFNNELIQGLIKRSIID